MSEVFLRYGQVNVTILCVFMFYGLMPEIKMDWIGLDCDRSC